MTAATPLLDRYPRTLHLWLKCDDKTLLAGIAAGQSVLELAEDLQREHISVMKHLSDLDLLEIDDGGEVWAEALGLSLAGVPLQVVIDWCTAAPGRLPAEDIESMAMGDLRGEFALARELGITVANSDAIEDLSWLMNYPEATSPIMAAACAAIIDRFDIVTPRTLKMQLQGVTQTFPARAWAPSKKKPAYRRKAHTKTRRFTSRKRTTGTVAKSRRKARVA
jgi:hypothetical protein